MELHESSFITSVIAHKTLQELVQRELEKEKGVVLEDMSPQEVELLDTKNDMLLQEIEVLKEVNQRYKAALEEIACIVSKLEGIKKKEEKKKKEITNVSEDAIRLSKLLFQLIKERNPNQKQPNFTAWAVHIERMIQIDGRSPEEIETMIRWCQADVKPRGKGVFCWANNILSTAKLREKYDQMYLQAKSGKGGSYIDDRTERQKKRLSELAKQFEEIARRGMDS